MKRSYFFVIILILAGILPGACVIEHHDDGWETNGGREAFNACEGNMQLLVSFLDLAIRMEHYLSVPENERFEAEQEYFPEYKIRAVGEQEWVGLLARDTAFRIITGGRSFLTEGAEWKIGKYRDVNLPAWAILTCPGPKQVTLDVQECQGFVWTTDAHLQFHYKEENLPENYHVGHWTIVGNGKCVAEPDEKGDYRILLEFGIDAEKLSPTKEFADKGEISMSVEDRYLQQKEDIKAEMELTPDQERLVRIFYKGKRYPY